MVKTRKSADPEESVLRDTREDTAIEHYRHSADRPKPRNPPANYRYVEELAHLQFELIKLQEWVRLQGLRVVVIFEGRDAAGKGGVIKRIIQSLNPRICRVVALGTPTERERGQWYFQRYVAQLPARGEIVLFDRSWYNRAGVEHVTGFCTERRVPRISALLSAFRGDAGSFWHLPQQVLVLGQRRGARTALPAANSQSDQALEAQPNGSRVAQALGRVLQGQG